MKRLYDTYESGMSLDLPGEDKLMPICHTPQNAHIKITINGDGDFKHADVLEKTRIVLPATEESAGRTGKIPPHPLADKIQYVAKDYAKYGSSKEAYYDNYYKQLSSWCESENVPEKVKAVKKYVERGTVVQDLISAKVLHTDDNGKLLRQWNGKKENTPLIFKVLPKPGGALEQGSALVCWNIEIAGEPVSESWKDPEIQRHWIDFDLSKHDNRVEGLCYITGKKTALAVNHPAKLRHTGDKAKIVSSNDDTGYTFRGRFTDNKKSIKVKGAQSVGVSYEVTQKAHNALRWLISRQGFRNGDQVIVAWTVSCKEIPQPLAEIPLDFEETPEQSDQGEALDHGSDMGQRFSLGLQKYMLGYRANLKDTDHITIMGLDSATSGRMAITYYQEFVPEEYINQISTWHDDFSWFQRVFRDEQVQWVVRAPSVHSIFDSIYGATIGDAPQKNTAERVPKLKKNTVERILPCIVGGRPFPADMVRLSVHRASNRGSYKKDEQWERNLGIACALYRGYCKRHSSKEYKMTIERENNSRDYLYGRLLAIAERIEDRALYIADEKRSTTAARLMQRFADRPYSTWRNIELALQPYMQRLKNNRYGGFLHNMTSLLDEVMRMFSEGDFTRDKPLSGEFLLAFHCQRLELRSSNKKEKHQTDSTETGDENEFDK
ncbi:MAG: type I-C CRISPR-associated protein Cas8c/Csd1 [Gammaproteobacteria bacterium]